MFEQSKNGLPEGVKFDACNFQIPPMNNANVANNFVGSLQLTGSINDGCNKDIEQNSITKVKIVNKSSINSRIKRTIEFPNLKLRRQLKMNNHIHLHGSPFLLAQPEVKFKFNKNLNILMIDRPRYI